MPLGKALRDIFLGYLAWNPWRDKDARKVTSNWARGICVNDETTPKSLLETFSITICVLVPGHQLSNAPFLVTTWLPQQQQQMKGDG